MWIIEDNDTERVCIIDNIKKSKLDRNYFFKYFELITDVITENFGPKFIILDLQALGYGDWKTIMSPIYNLINKFPSTIFLIYSGVERDATDAIDDIKEQFQSKNAMVFKVKVGDVLGWNTLMKKF